MGAQHHLLSLFAHGTEQNYYFTVTTPNTKRNALTKAIRMWPLVLPFHEVCEVRTYTHNEQCQPHQRVAA